MPTFSYHHRPHCRLDDFLLLFAEPDAAVTYTLSLHDALPICTRRFALMISDHGRLRTKLPSASMTLGAQMPLRHLRPECHRRSEEHTSELQSQSNLVCRLLLEKKKIKQNIYMLCRAHQRAPLL